MGLYNKPQQILGVPGLKLYKNTKTATIEEVKSYSISNKLFDFPCFKNKTRYNLCN